MVETASTMPPLGLTVTDFTLMDTRCGESFQLSQNMQQKPVLLAFICNHCPYVVHIIQPFTDLLNEYQKKGFCVVALSSNNVITHPQDAPEKMTTLAEKYNFQFPYCYDETQAIAKQYQAACTPDFFLYNQQHELFYRGQFDSSRPGNNHPVTGESLRRAMDCVLDNRLLDVEQRPSMGCNIKWKE